MLSFYVFFVIFVRIAVIVDDDNIVNVAIAVVLVLVDNDIVVDVDIVVKISCCC